jgi:hypothetical protein
VYDGCSRIGCGNLDVCNSVMDHGRQQAKRATWAVMVLCGLSIWRSSRYEIDSLKCQESFRPVWTSFSFSVCNRGRSDTSDVWSITLIWTSWFCISRCDVMFNIEGHLIDEQFASSLTMSMTKWSICGTHDSLDSIRHPAWRWSMRKIKNFTDNWVLIPHPARQRLICLCLHLDDDRRQQPRTVQVRPLSMFGHTLELASTTTLIISIGL